MRWNLFFHYLAVSLPVLSGVVLVPLYLAHVPLAMYGAWLATGNVLAWITIVDPGLSSVVQQRCAVAFGAGDKESLGGLLAASVVLSGLVAIVVLGLGMFVAELLGPAIVRGEGVDFATLRQACVLQAIGSALMMFSFGLAAFNLGIQASLGIGMVYVVSVVAGLVVTAVLLVADVGLISLPIGEIVRGAGLTIGNGSYIAWRLPGSGVRWRLSPSVIRSVLKLSAFTWLGRLAGVVTSSMDAIVLSSFAGVAAVPAYSLTKKSIEIGRGFLERPASAFAPAVASLVGAGQVGRAKEILIRLTRLMVWGLAMASAGLVTFNFAFVSLWVGPELFAGPLVGSVFVGSMAVSVVVTTFSTLCFALGNIRGNSVAGFVQAALTVAFALLATAVMGSLGLALAPAVAALLVGGWYYPRTFGRLLHLERADYQDLSREVGRAALAAGVTVVVFSFLPVRTWVALSLLAIGFVATFALALALLSPPFREEVRGMRTLLS